MGSLISGGMGSLIGGVASGIGSLIGGGQAASASEKAAELQHQQYLQTRADLLPYNTAGQTALPALEGYATSGPLAGGPDYISQAAAARPPSVFTQQDLMATPGYQFVLGQGLKSTQAANAAKGLGVSGAALKGAATYATGLADNTYGNRFNEAQTAFNDVLGLNQAYQGNVQNAYTRAQGLATLGENAAATTGAQGTQAAANQGNYLNQAGLANAAGTSGFGNAITSGINNYLGYNAYQNRTAAMTPANPSGGTYSYAQQQQDIQNYG